MVEMVEMMYSTDLSSHGGASDNGSFGLPSDSASMPTGVGHSAHYTTNPPPAFTTALGRAFTTALGRSHNETRRYNTVLHQEQHGSGAYYTIQLFGDKEHHQLPRRKRTTEKTASTRRSHHRPVLLVSSDRKNTNSHDMLNRCIALHSNILIRSPILSSVHPSVQCSLLVVLVCVFAGFFVLLLLVCPEDKL